MNDYQKDLEEGSVYELKVDAKGARGEGIGRLGSAVVFIKNAKTRIGNIYKVKVTKVYRTFAYAELNAPKHQFIGNGSIIEL
ncbi:MAG: TRAM domain-containing protein [Candidatus Micrarchaeota archaeon]|nr:TRAM domain-containing protein [Candidatus Micrarchaeota archaeon]